MRSKLLLVPLIALLAAALACAGEGVSPTLEPGVRFKDDFSRSGAWDSVSEGGTGSVGYSNGEYVIRVDRPTYRIWGNLEEDFTDIHVEVTVRSVGAAGAGFGVLCGYKDEKNHYALGISDDGFYAIERVVDDESIVLTDPDDLWAPSDRIPVGAESYQLTAECAGGQLSLYVNGEQIAFVRDTSFSSGQIGLFASSYEEPGAEVHFDDLYVRDVE